MNANHFLAAALLSALSTTSFADTTSRPLTRAEVKAELAQAVSAGTMPVDMEDGVPHDLRQPSVLTRTEVREELARAVDEGTMPIDMEDGVPHDLRPNATAGTTSN